MNSLETKKNGGDVGNKKFDMYFHTILRNIGLYTSLSFGSLAYSRFHRGKSAIYNIVLILITLAFLLLSFVLNYNLNKDVNTHLEQNKENENKYLLISHIILGIHILLISLCITTLVWSFLYYNRI